jgi:hypothetical protein
MFRTALIASVLALGTAAAAQAQDLSPRLIGGGADGGPQVVYAEPSQNVVGGGFARLIGEGGSRSLAYAGPTTSQVPSGLIGQLVGGGNEQALAYVPAPAASTALAGRSTRHGG